MAERLNAPHSKCGRPFGSRGFKSPSFRHFNTSFLLSKLLLVCIPHIHKSTVPFRNAFHQISMLYLWGASQSMSFILLKKQRPKHGILGLCRKQGASLQLQLLRLIYSLLFGWQNKLIGFFSFLGTFSWLWNMSFCCNFTHCLYSSA